MAHHGARLGLAGLVLVLIFGRQAFAGLTAPQQLSPLQNARTQRMATFTWSPVAGATWYYLWITCSSDNSVAPLKQWVQGVTTYTLPEENQLLPGNAYTWFVQAWDQADGTGPWSAGAPFSVGHTRTLVIGAAEFCNEDHNGWQYDTRLGYNGTWYEYFDASVHLPANALIVSMSMSYREEDPTGTIFTALRRYDPMVDGSESQIAEADSGPAQVGVTRVGTAGNLSERVIGDEDYFVTVGFPMNGIGGNREVYGVKVTYID